MRAARPGHCGAVRLRPVPAPGWPLPACLLLPEALCTPAEWGGQHPPTLAHPDQTQSHSKASSTDPKALSQRVRTRRPPDRRPLQQQPRGYGSLTPSDPLSVPPCTYQFQGSRTPTPSLVLWRPPPVTFPLSGRDYRSVSHRAPQRQLPGTPTLSYLPVLRARCQGPLSF